MPHLTDLEATFVGNRHADGSYSEIVSAREAQGVLFICPKCGNHSVLCWFEARPGVEPVPDDAFPRPGRWAMTGDSIDTLTMLPSIDLSKKADGTQADGCLWHGFVTNGEAR